MHAEARGQGRASRRGAETSRELELKALTLLRLCELVIGLRLGRCVIVRRCRLPWRIFRQLLVRLRLERRSTAATSGNRLERPANARAHARLKARGSWTAAPLGHAVLAQHLTGRAVAVRQHELGPGLVRSDDQLRLHARCHALERSVAVRQQALLTRQALVLACIDSFGVGCDSRLDSFSGVAADVPAEHHENAGGRCMRDARGEHAEHA